MFATVVADAKSERIANLILDFVAEIDTWEVLNPTRFSSRYKPISVPDVVLVVMYANSEERTVRSYEKAVSLLSFDARIPTIAVLVGEVAHFDSTFKQKWSFILCEGTSRDDCYRASRLVSDLLPSGAAEELPRAYMSLRRIMHNRTRIREIVFVIFGIVASIGILLLASSEGILSDLKYPDDAAVSAVTVETFLMIIMLFTAMVASYYGLLTVSRPVREERRREELEEALQYSRRLRRVVTREKFSDESKPGVSKAGESRRADALERMLVNLEDIKQYYTWSQEQARSAFRMAELLCVAGFVFLVVAAFLPSLLGLGTEASVILAVGGAASELVAGTALLVYRHSLSQLNHYHEALHEDERFLSSISLLDRFSTSEQKDLILTEIVRSELEMNLAAVWGSVGEADSSNARKEMVNNERSSASAAQENS